MGTPRNATANASSKRSVSRASSVDNDGAFRLQIPVGSVVDVKSSQVVPTGPVLNSFGRETKPSLRKVHREKLSFFDAFGALGVPMVAILVVCVVWTAWLMLISLAPNEASNALMNTGAYDNGQFWLIVDPTPGLTLAGVFVLLIVGVCYVVVLLKMLIWRERVLTPTVLRRLENRLLDSWKDSSLESRTWTIVVSPVYRRVHKTWSDFTLFSGNKRKFWNVFTKAIDLVMQTVVLLQLLERGSPIGLVYGYALFVAINALSCAINILADPFTTLAEVLVDSIFDFSAAVLFPIVTLVYSYYNFDFDREVYLTYLVKLPPGSFERIARLFADETEVALFRVSFDSLRFRSPLDLATRVAMNLAFCYRIKRMMEVMVWRKRHAWVSGRTLRKSSGSIAPVEPKKPVPKVAAVVFAGFSIAVLVATQQAVAHSSSACAEFPECAVFAYRWTISDDACPCLSYIDVDKAPNTFEDWIHPPDAYNKVQALARSGLLESIQVINRQLLEFPEELRECKHLRAIQLMYTSIQHLPTWTSEFKDLETLHMEGKLGSLNIAALPENLFSNMPSLVMVHLGIHEALAKIPPLTGVPQLQSLSLAWMFRLHQLPSFDRVPDLRRLMLAVMPLLESIPDLSPLTKLVDFSILPGVICCNGFLGACDLSDFYCRGNPAIGIPAATCLADGTDPTQPAAPYFNSSGTRRVFEKFAPGICRPMPFDAAIMSTVPTQETVDMCGGKLFRQCRIGSSNGMCYNTRFQVLACLIDGSHIALRRYQIEKGVGPQCDPIEEQWLGCEEK